MQFKIEIAQHIQDTAEDIYNIGLGSLHVFQLAGKLLLHENM